MKNEIMNCATEKKEVIGLKDIESSERLVKETILQMSEYVNDTLDIMKRGDCPKCDEGGKDCVAPVYDSRFERVHCNLISDKEILDKVFSKLREIREYVES